MSCAFAFRAIHCIEDNNGELKKSITTKKKLKKALGDDDEQI